MVDLGRLMDLSAEAIARRRLADSQSTLSACRAASAVNAVPASAGVFDCPLWAAPLAARLLAHFGRCRGRMAAAKQLVLEIALTLGLPQLSLGGGSDEGAAAAVRASAAAAATDAGAAAASAAHDMSSSSSLNVQQVLPGSMPAMAATATAACPTARSSTSTAVQTVLIVTLLAVAASLAPLLATLLLLLAAACTAAAAGRPMQACQPIPQKQHSRKSHPGGMVQAAVSVVLRQLAGGHGGVNAI